MIPDITRTGKVNINSKGFTSYFSIDDISRSFSVRYYGDWWKEFPDHLQRKLAEMVSATWVAAIPSEKKVFTHRVDQTDIDLLGYISHQTYFLYRRRMALPNNDEGPTMYVTRDDNNWGNVGTEPGISIFFGGGYKSFATFGFCEKSGQDVQLLTANNGVSWEATEKSREELDIDTLWTNFSLIKRELVNEHDINLESEAPRHILTFLTGIPMLENDSAVFGAEKGTTKFVKSGNHMIHDKNWELSTTTMSELTDWIRGKGLDISVSSHLRGIDTTSAIRTVKDIFPWFKNLVVSCDTCNSQNNYQPCSRCSKCLRNYLVLRSWGFETDHDTEVVSKFMPDPRELISETFEPKELSDINDRISYWDSVPTSSDNPINPKVTEELDRKQEYERDVTVTNNNSLLSL